MKVLVSDALWKEIKDLLPGPRSRPRGGRPLVDNRTALEGVLFVLKSGIPWAMLPGAAFGVSGMTCWRRLRDWHQAGVWAALHVRLLERLHQAGKLDWNRASVDSASVAAKKGGLWSARARRTAARRLPSATWP